MNIRVGIGGWTFEPWRGTFFPKGLKHAEELSYASRHTTSIEVNGTFYRTQSPDTFARWADEAPDDFIFSLKAPRFTTNRKVLAEAGESIERFTASGIDRLGPKLGPILWQFAPTKRFDPDDFAAFLALLPEDASGVRLRHAVEVRHETFRDPAFLEVLRPRNVALVYAHSDDYPEIADPTADFIYARLQRTREEEAAGYASSELDAWAERARLWSKGDAPKDLPMIGKAPKSGAREVFIYFISGAKVRAPAAAQALIARLGES
ncbi:DUF72 domain-containing protein [Terrihabitans sp. B22-R8]|uniref:DUF72 domain-containing protein n=1 Tax=Terrihabitans sp. B22-R8 TaxID=3425128 RepID=UPI00403D137F